jgi:NADH-quinone oxidoreductase subunit A
MAVSSGGWVSGSELDRTGSCKPVGPLIGGNWINRLNYSPARRVVTRTNHPPVWTVLVRHALGSRREATMGGYFDNYVTVGVLLLVGVAFVAVALSANWLLRPGRATGPAAFDTYECGVEIDAVDRDWAQTHIRYYVYAFIYVVFAVETVFVYPWATIFTKPGYGAGALAEMGVFVALLALGLLYAWRKRVLRWA